MSPDLMSAVFGFVALAGYALVGVGVLVAFVAIALATLSLVAGHK